MCRLYRANAYLLWVGHCVMNLTYNLIHKTPASFCTGEPKQLFGGVSTPSFLAHVAWEAWIQPDLQAWTQKPELGHSDLFTTRPMTQTQLIKTFHETFTKS